MKTLIETDHKFAETLTSLILEPQAEARQSQFKFVTWFAGILIFAGIIALASWAVFRHLDGNAALPADAGDVQATDMIATDAASRHSHGAADPLAKREITGSGYVVAPGFTTVFARYEGRVTAVTAELGQRVAAGQPLVQMEDRAASIRLLQAQAARRTAQLALAARHIALTQAEARLRRLDLLVKSNAIARIDVEDAQAARDKAENDVALAELEIERASLQVDTARDQLDELTVRAPISGTITRLNVRIGDTVLARADSLRENQSLLTLTDVSSQMVEADIAEANLATLRPGLTGEAALDGYPGQAFSVELVRIAPEISPEKGTVLVRFKPVNPPQGMRPGMATRIRLSVPEMLTPEQPTAKVAAPHAHAQIGFAQ